MLLSLRIENFALIDSLTLELGSGLTVLTGETGAGKSIILDAIDAALGGKVTSRAVRTGAERALVEATFRVGSDLSKWLQEREIEPIDNTEIVCSREIVASQGSQRNRSRINGVLMNKQQMEQLRDRLVEITAQGQTVQIGQPPLQREWLDIYGGETLLKQRAEVAAAHAAAQQALHALEKRRKSEQERLQQLDLFDYQLRELRAAHLSDPDELDQLEQERKRLSHSVELQQQSYQVYQALYQNDSGAEACADLLGTAETTLQDMVEYDAQIQPILDLVSNALAMVEQAGREVNLYGESIEADPQRLQEVQERIVELKQVCRKYGPALADAIALRDRLQAEVEDLTGGGQSLEDLEQTYQTKHARMLEVCADLTQRRQTAAKHLEERLVAELKPLAMEKVQFRVAIEPMTPSALGADRVTFLFSPNPGEPLQPLTEIASGGEMSRFLLALQASFSQVESAETMVFDEIDVGVSGRVTQAIAEKLYQISQQHQVLCVTHQPIVAAMADQHLQVSKQVIDTGNGANGNGRSSNGKTAKKDSSTSNSSDVRTVVRVTTLDTNQRREELAQLAGGQTAQEAIAFAESLLSQAATLRQGQSMSSPAPLPEVKPRSKATRSKAAKRG
ncbi:DNA repair protein RecN [Leptolyngbya sp. FACHB-36]|uniref:DNA repair protein RecN n=1 Tax=Leptolyngbya sp. FACHB-36 TaxID=2692808 RepID=UPI001680E804|nr:DNA repair protein RecN [Leptolyngbya sp. FACHB-36]MBD2020460.1 DNA repair protein RecN [Leptolyngbya sp. FACHB-36]